MTLPRLPPVPRFLLAAALLALAAPPARAADPDTNPAATTNAPAATLARADDEGWPPLPAAVERLLEEFRTTGK